MAVPSAIAVTNPADETVAMDEFDVAHVTVAPEMMVPPASLTVATRVTVSPSDWKASKLGDNSTVAATWLTVTVAVALADPEVAVIVAVPSVTAVTRPADETVATEASDVTQATVGFEITLPPASTPVATSVAVSPIDVKLRFVGDSVTDIATWLTVAVAVALADPEVAVIVAVPSATAVTTAARTVADETVATAASDVAHVTVGFEITVPPASLTVATRVAPSPIDVKLRLVGDSVTDAAV